MLIRTEGYTKYSQGQRIDLEIIDPRDLIIIAYRAIRYGFATILLNVITKMKRYAILDWNRPVDEMISN